MITLLILIFVLLVILFGATFIAVLSQFYVINLALVENFLPKCNFEWAVENVYKWGGIIFLIALICCFLSRLSQSTTFMYFAITLLDLTYEYDKAFEMAEVPIWHMIAIFGGGFIIALVIFSIWSAIRHKIGQPLGWVKGCIPACIEIYCIFYFMYFPGSENESNFALGYCSDCYADSFYYT